MRINMAIRKTLRIDEARGISDTMYERTGTPTPRSVGGDLSLHPSI